MTTIIPLTLSMSNAYLLSGEKHILVDTGSSRDLPALTRQLDQHSVPLSQIALIIITHAHFDHAGTAAAIQKQAGCPVAIHTSEKSCLEKGENAPIVPIHPLARLLSPFVGLSFAPVDADILIEDTLDLSAYGVAAKVISTPGHTSGSISVLTGGQAGNGHALVGDLVGGGRLLGQFQPRKPRYHYWASSLEDVQTSLKTVFSYNPSRLYVGHGGPLDGLQAQSFFSHITKK